MNLSSSFGNIRLSPSGHVCSVYIENINTWMCGNMKFILSVRTVTFECTYGYFTSEQSKRVRYPVQYVRLSSIIGGENINRQ